MKSRRVPTDRVDEIRATKKRTGDRIHVLLEAGLEALGESHSNAELRFEVWRKGFAERLGQSLDTPSPGRAAGLAWSEAIWVWNALRRYPGLSIVMSSTRSAWQPWVGRGEKLPLFPPGTLLQLDPGGAGWTIQNPEWKGSGKEPERIRCATIRLRDELCLVPGSRDRLHLASAQCVLELLVSATADAATEAALMRVSEESLTIDPKRRAIRVDARSLNHAYLLASRRLEPNRISHGGSVYRAVRCQVPGEPGWVSLRALREHAESMRLREILDGRPVSRPAGDRST